jgi:hypothetical protein
MAYADALDARSASANRSAYGEWIRLYDRLITLFRCAINEKN